MYILNIETTGQLGSVSLSLGNSKLLYRHGEHSLSHLKEITYLIDQLFKEADIKPRDLDAIGISVGPGSFTGIRIGVATAKTLSQFLNIPCLILTSLDVFKSIAMRENKTTIAILNARRDQVYAGAFNGMGESIYSQKQTMIGDIIDFAKTLRGDIIFCGDGVDAYREKLAQLEEIDTINIIYPEEELRYQNAYLMAPLTEKLYLDKEFTPWHKVKADYMRLAEAEMKLKSGDLARERERKLAKFRENL